MQIVVDQAVVQADLEKSGLSPILQRVERAITTSAVWGVQPGAAREDVLSTWQQLVVLHQKTHALLREKKDAELAKADAASESYDRHIALAFDAGIMDGQILQAEREAEGL